MELGNIRPPAGATRAPKRRGKGTASGIGGTAGRGHKGHKARTGGQIPAWFEGGQMPIQRRVPKRGFRNASRTAYQPLNLGQLASVAGGTVVDRAWLVERGVIRRPGPIKLLGKGEVKVALTVRVDAASESATRAIEAAGGRVELTRAKA